MAYPGLDLVNAARSIEHETMLHLIYGDDLGFIGPCNQWTQEDFEEARAYHARREEENLNPLPPRKTSSLDQIPDFFA